MKRLIQALFILVAATCIFSTAYAGNRKIIEKKIGELDALNREVVKQIPDLPPDGRVHVKAFVLERGKEKRIKLLEQDIEPGRKDSAFEPDAVQAFNLGELMAVQKKKPDAVRHETFSFINYQEKVSSEVRVRQ